MLCGMPEKTTRTDDKVRYNRIWRMAARQALRLEKSPLRDPHAIGYQTYRLRADDDTVVAGKETVGKVKDFGLTLDEVEQYLTGGNR